MINRKTAAYTIIGPLELGAMIAKAREEDIQGIKEWGTPFGYAFQIWDDYMNIKTSTKNKERKLAAIYSKGNEHCSCHTYLNSAARARDLK